MTLLTFEQVETVLKAMAVLYPEQQLDDQPHNAARVRLIVAQYFEDFQAEGMSAEQMAAAIKVCRRECVHFPRIAQIIKAHRDLMAKEQNKRQDHVALPPMSDEECFSRMAKGREMLDGLCERWGVVKRMEKP